MLSQTTSALISQNIKSWYWTSDTKISSVVTGDVNGDGQLEIVTGGYYNDGTRWVAQLVVWDGAASIVKNVMTWYWNYDTQISSVAVANITGGSGLDIVTGGSYFDGTRWVAQLVVWNGTNLALENVRVWYWNYDTQISSVAVANITGGSGLDIVTGGSYFDGTRYNSQLVVWNGTNLALENVKVWNWNADTYINSVAIGDVTGNGVLSIVTGGSYFDGTRYNSQLVSWDAATLSVNNIQVWYWTGNTEISAVAVANITSGNSLTIVTGGSYFDGSQYNSQLATWNGQTLSLNRVISWHETANTKITSVAVGNYSNSGSLDIISGGTYNDGSVDNGQLIDFKGSDLTVISLSHYFWTSNTEINIVAIGNVAGIGNRIIVGGSFFDLSRSNAHLSIWG